MGLKKEIEIVKDFYKICKDIFLTRMRTECKFVEPEFVKVEIEDRVAFVRKLKEIYNLDMLKESDFIYMENSDDYWFCIGGLTNNIVFGAYNDRHPSKSYPVLSYGEYNTNHKFRESFKIHLSFKKDLCYLTYYREDLNFVGSFMG